MIWRRTTENRSIVLARRSIGKYLCFGRISASDLDRAVRSEGHSELALLSGRTNIDDARLVSEVAYWANMEKLNFARAARRRKMERLFDLVTRVHNDESGQGLVEYLLIVALVALAATAGMSSAASYINSAFIRIGGKLGQYVS